MQTIKVNRKDISNTSENPIFDYCRKLIKDGIDPTTRLEVWRNNPEPDLTISSIGWGAKWTVDVWMLRPYRESHLKGRSKAGQASHSDLK